MSGYKLFTCNLVLHLILLPQEYDFNQQFWSQIKLSPGGPSPRWGAAGGIDTSTPPIQDPIVPGPNNTFYLVGGYDGSQVDSLADVWRLNISGTLSSNLPYNASGSWDRVSLPISTPKFNHSGVVISNTIVLTGGCNSTTSLDDCPQQASYIINSQLQTEVFPTACPAPRTGPVLVANLNKFTTTFSSQVFLLLGIVNNTKWDDGGALTKGEVVSAHNSRRGNLLIVAVRLFLISARDYGAESYPRGIRGSRIPLSFQRLEMALPLSRIRKHSLVRLDLHHQTHWYVRHVH